MMSSLAPSYLPIKSWLTKNAFAVKLIIVLAIGYVVINRVLHIEQSDEMWKHFLERQGQFNIGLLLFISICLTLLNWGIETSKWQKLLNHHFHFTFLQSMKSVVMGIAVGLITPARVGEYGGRLINIPDEYKMTSLYGHGLSSLAQNIVNVFFGAISLFLFTYLYLKQFLWIGAAISSGILMLIGIFGFLYLNNGPFAEWLKIQIKPKWIHKLHFDKFRAFGKDLMMHILLLSALRYFVFCIQYMLLLHFFGLNIPVGGLFLGVSVIYLIQSGIPLPPFIALFARGEIAVTVWSVFYTNPISALCATFSLWILNLLLPSVVGMGVLMMYKKEKSIEKD